MKADLTSLEWAIIIVCLLLIVWAILGTMNESSHQQNERYDFEEKQDSSENNLT